MRTFRELYEQKQMRIVMLGGPGSGKSTYTEYLIRHFRINPVSYTHLTLPTKA